MSGSINKIDPPLYRRRMNPNNSYTDYAYREAMQRLKNLLSEPYVPPAHLTTIIQRPVYESTSSFIAGSHHDHHTFPGRPSIKEVSKYFPGTNIVRATCYTQPNHSTDKPLIREIPSGVCPSAPIHFSGTTSSTVPSASDQSNQELLRFIEKQENYIKQIERESDANREELNSLKFKVQELMHENDSLQRQNDSDSDHDFGKSSTVVMLEAKVSDLEAKLSQEKLEVKRLRDENDALKSKIASGAGLEVVESFKRKVEDLLREKQRLQDEVRRLENKIQDMNSRTYDSSYYTKSLGRDFGERGADKTHLEIEVRRLKVCLIIKKKM